MCLKRKTQLFKSFENILEKVHFSLMSTCSISKTDFKSHFLLRCQMVFLWSKGFNHILQLNVWACITIFHPIPSISPLKSANQDSLFNRIPVVDPSRKVWKTNRVLSILKGKFCSSNLPSFQPEVFESGFFSLYY